MAKKKVLESGKIAEAMDFIQSALGVPAGVAIDIVSATYTPRTKQWDFLAVVGRESYSVTYHSAVVENGFIVGGVWAM